MGVAFLNAEAISLLHELVVIRTDRPATTHRLLSQSVHRALFPMEEACTETMAAVGIRLITGDLPTTPHRFDVYTVTHKHPLTPLALLSHRERVVKSCADSMAREFGVDARTKSRRSRALRVPKNGCFNL